MEDGRRSSPQLGGWIFVKRGEKEKRSEIALLALGSPQQWFHLTCATTAFKRVLYIQFCLLIQLKPAARTKHLLFDKEETHGPFQIHFSYLLAPIC